MTTLSLTMIVKNEEETLERVLSCVKPLCDEMVIVDTGSTDRTVEIAQRMGARVCYFEWVDDFAAARNFAMAQCTGDWLIWLDADDVISEECLERMLELKHTVLNDSFDGVFIPYRIGFNSLGHCISSLTRERFFRRAAGLTWIHPVHEGIVIDVNRAILRTDMWVDHRPLESRDPLDGGRNLYILEKAIQNGNNHPRTYYFHAVELRIREQFERALESYTHYMGICQNQTQWEIYDAHTGMGICYKALGRLDEAIGSYLKAVQVDSRRAEAYNNLGFIYMDRREYDKALPYFLAATHLSKPTSDGNISDQDYTWIPNDYASLCYYHTGNHIKAIEYALKGLPYHPVKEQLIKNLHAFVDCL